MRELHVDFYLIITQPNPNDKESGTTAKVHIELRSAYRQTPSMRRIKYQNLNADRRCYNYIWVINNFIAS